MGRPMREQQIAARLAQTSIGLLLDQSGIEHADRKKLTFYFLHMSCGISQPMIGAINGCTKQNVSKHIAEIERRRDADARLDALVDAIEQKILES